MTNPKTSQAEITKLLGDNNKKIEKLREKISPIENKHTLYTAANSQLQAAMLEEKRINDEITQAKKEINNRDEAKILALEIQIDELSAQTGKLQDKVKGLENENQRYLKLKKELDKLQVVSNDLSAQAPVVIKPVIETTHANRTTASTGNLSTYFPQDKATLAELEQTTHFKKDPLASSQHGLKFRSDESNVDVSMNRNGFLSTLPQSTGAKIETDIQAILRLYLTGLEALENSLKASGESDVISNHKIAVPSNSVMEKLFEVALAKALVANNKGNQTINGHACAEIIKRAEAQPEPPQEAAGSSIQMKA